MGPERHYGKDSGTHLKLTLDLRCRQSGFARLSLGGSQTISSQPYYNAAPLPRYVSTSFRARIVTVLLIIGAFVSLAATLLAVAELVVPGELFGDGESEDPLTLVLALFAIGLALLEIVVYIATVVFFLMWLYRSRENLAAFGVRKNSLEYSSGWAVGSFFVPFVNLVIPYRAIKELWRKSVPNSDSMFSELSPPGFFPLWWAFWLLSNFAERIYFRMSWRENVSSDITAAVGVLAGLLSITAALLAVMIVREIERQQIESSRLLASTSSLPHPPAPPEFFASPSSPFQTPT